jgi:putative glutamine amidotransferase
VSAGRLRIGLSAEAVSPVDGVVDAIRRRGASYAVGLQRHPEFHASANAGLLDGSPVLTEFLAQARRARA